jgi:hypothetical protein
MEGSSQGNQSDGLKLNRQSLKYESGMSPSQQEKGFVEHLYMICRNINVDIPSGNI